jgi:hypothetical protein
MPSASGADRLPEGYLLVALFAAIVCSSSHQFDS